MNPVPFVILYLIPAATSAALAVYAWKQRHYRQAGPFGLLMAALAFWSTCHALSVADMTLEGTLFWSQLQYGGVVLVGPLLLLFALAYADQWAWATAKMRVVLYAPSLLLFIAVMTNESHHLWWTSVAPDTSRPFLSLAVERGILFWVHTAYSYLCILAGIGLFIHTMLEAPPIYRYQAQLVVIGAFIPVAGNIAHLLGLQVRWVDDPTPFLFAATSLFLFYATLRYQLLDLAPIAQREVFESMPDGVVVLDRQGVVAMINQHAPDLLAVEPARWVGKKFVTLIDHSPLAPSLRTVLSTPATPASQRVQYAGEDGLHGVEIRLRPLHTGRGTYAGSLLVLRDTTERVRMEQALGRRLEELTIINEAARATSAAMQVDDVLRTVTHAIVRSLRWDRVAIGLSQSDGQTLQLVVDHARDAGPSLEGQYLSANDFEPIMKVLHTRQICVLQAGDHRSNDTSVEGMLQGLGLRMMLSIPLYSQSQPIGVFFLGSRTAKNISTNEIRLAETLGELVTEAVMRTRLYEAAQQASQLKSALLATISHELRTPLTSILGYEELLQREIFGPLPEHVREPLGNMRHSGLILLRLIGDILDFSKLEAGLFTIDLHPVDLTSVVNNVADTMRPQIYERGLSFHVELADALPLVRGNSARLEQVLTNLVSNAIKFTDTGAITIWAEQRGSHVRLSVQDTGIGIAPEHQAVIFREFYQVQNLHTQRVRGTGLGLSISRRLIELMDGTLSLESAPGVGSTFRCDLRLATVSTLEQVQVRE